MSGSRRRILLIVAILLVALCAGVIARLGPRWVLQTRAWHGPGASAAASVKVTSSRFEPVPPEFSFNLGTIELGLPAPPEGIEFDDRYTRFRLRSRGMIVVIAPRGDAEAPRQISELVALAEAAPVGAWTLTWMSGDAFDAHIARLAAGLVVRVSAETYEVIRGDGVTALVSKFRGDDGRAGAAFVWYEREGMAVNIHAVDVEDPPGVLREVVVRTRARAK